LIRLSLPTGVKPLTVLLVIPSDAHLPKATRSAGFGNLCTIAL
jgi:hypothetical protein